jgi:hypothetical protein
LADTEKTCPLCGLRVYHPDLPQPDAAPAYPADTCPPPWRHSFLPHLAIAIACLIPCLVVLLAVVVLFFVLTALFNFLYAVSAG